MPFNLGAPELIIILVVVLIIFGPGRLPSIGQSLGKGIREFRKSTSGNDDDDKKPEPAPVAPAAAAPTPVAPAAAVPAPVEAPKVEAPKEPSAPNS